MRKTKRFLAVALAATMVIGSSVTVFADDNHSSTGTGSNEGHVDKHVISVTLPTVPDGSTPFNYTIDPERLVTATSGSRYTNDFTDDAKTNGVYFLTGVAATDDTYAAATVADADAFAAGEFYIEDSENAGQYVRATEYDASASYFTKTAGTAASSKYDSKSDALVTTSESSADIELTVEVAAANDGNVTLVNAAPSLDEATDDAQLYLALMVGTDATVIKAGEKVSKTVTIAGVDSNFTTTYNNTSNKYEYTVIDSPAAWGNASFYLTGVASKSDAENVTAPTLTVTWKYEDPAAVVDAAPSAPATATYSKADGAEITLSLGSGDLAATGVTSIQAKNAEDGDLYDAASASFANGKLTITSAQWPAAPIGSTRWVVIKFNDDDETTKTIVVTVEE